MVYCKLISVDETTIKYAVGGLDSDITGELSVDKNDYSFMITKRPAKSVILDKHVDRLLRKHRSEFIDGVFKESIAYEIG